MDPAVIVLGAPGSGTGYVASRVAHAGVDMGMGGIDARRMDHPHFVEMTSLALEAAGWRRDHPAACGDVAVLPSGARLSSEGRWGWKGSGAARLARKWLELYPGVPVLCVRRHPTASAFSYWRRKHYKRPGKYPSQLAAYLLDALQIRDELQKARRDPWLDVDYSSLGGCSERVSEFLGAGVTFSGFSPPDASLWREIERWA